MRIGVISDIHGNRVALDAVLDDVANHPVDRWVCLGDAILGGCQPVEVAERLQALDCPVVLGNADAFVLGDWDAVGERSEQILRVRDWTANRLGPRVDFLQTFQPTIRIHDLFCFHGTPDSYIAPLLPETPADELRRELGGQDAKVMCGGHTHLQWTVSLDSWMFFNPGSVGMAFNRHLPRDDFHFFSPVAEFAILHVEDDTTRIEFCRVPFDVDAHAEAARTSGHPYAEDEMKRFSR